MVLVKLALLLAKKASNELEVTVAVLTASEGVTAVVTMVMVALVPVVMVPKLQVTTPDAWLQVPTVELEET